MTNETITAGTVVVGYAGLQDADHALKWAAEQAVLEGRTLTLVHAVEPLTGYEYGVMAGAYLVPDDVTDALMQEGRDLLAEGSASVQERFPSLHVETALYRGRPSEVLLAHVAQAASLVVGSRGRGRVASTLLGSVSVTVARKATCPVVVVRPHHPGKVRNGVLVGTDCSENTRATLDYAYREASLRQLPLTVLFSVPGVAEIEDGRIDLAEAIAGMGEIYPDVRVSTCLGSGVPDKWLISESDSMDLVVVGHHHATGFNDVIGNGSYAISVVERASCPVAVVFGAALDHVDA